MKGVVLQSLAPLQHEGGAGSQIQVTSMSNPPPVSSPLGSVCWSAIRLSWSLRCVRKLVTMLDPPPWPSWKHFMTMTIWINTMPDCIACTPPPLSFPRGGWGTVTCSTQNFSLQLTVLLCGKTTTQECCPKHSSGKW